MNNENISNAMNMIDDRMLGHTASRRLMNRKSSLIKWSLPKVAAAILGVCLIGGTSAYAAISGGFFKDKTNAIGTVTGQSYENATEEITITASPSGDIGICFIKYGKPPYTLPGTEVDIYLDGYQVMDSTGNKILDAPERQKLDISEGNALASFDTSSLTSGTYTLAINGFIAESKADQPLVITGEWKIDFTID